MTKILPFFSNQKHNATCKVPESISLTPYPTQPFSWTDDLQLGYILPNGRAGYVKNREDLPAVAYRFVRVNVVNRDTGHSTANPPNGWTWLINSALDQRPNTTLISDRHFRVATFTDHQGAWQAQRIATEAMIFAESLPQSATQRERQTNSEQLTKYLGAHSPDSGELLDISNIELQRRRRDVETREPTQADFFLDRPAFAQNGLVIYREHCPNDQRAKEWALEHDVDTLIADTPRASRLKSYFEHVLNKKLQYPFLLSHSAVIEGFDTENSSPNSWNSIRKFTLPQKPLKTSEP